MGNYDGWRDYAGPTTDTARPVKRSKFGAKSVTVDGLRFDSKREASRYAVLKVRMQAGDIRRLRCQPRYALCPLIIEHGDVRDINTGSNSPRRCPVSEYVADFEYEESDRGYGGISWRLVIEDTKGVRTDIYKLKKRWFETQYGIAVVEV